MAYTLFQMLLAEVYATDGGCCEPFSNFSSLDRDEHKFKWIGALSLPYEQKAGSGKKHQSDAEVKIARYVLS